MSDWNPEALLDLAIKLYGAGAVRKQPRKRLAAAAAVLAESKAVCESGFRAELFVRALVHDEARAAALMADVTVPWNKVWKQAPLAYSRGEDFKNLVTRFFEDWYSTSEPVPAGEDPTAWRAQKVQERVALWKNQGVPGRMIETLKAFKDHGAKYRERLLAEHVESVKRGS